MKVNVLSFSSKGGAGLVAKSLATGFAKIGFDAKLITASNSDLRSHPMRNPMLTASATLDHYLLRTPNRRTPVSVIRDRHSLLLETLEKSDLTVFKWMNGLLGESFLEQNSNLGEVVWGLDDMNPFTGVCHYSESCRGFEFGCIDCPALKTPINKLAGENLQRKIRIADKYSIRYSAPSDWMLSEFRKSILGRDREVEKILNPLREEFLNYTNDGHESSAELRILIIAANLDDPSKGVLDTEPMLNKLSNDAKFSVTLIGRASRSLRSRLREATFLGQMKTHELISQLKKQDLLLVPSLNENAGMVISEAASQKIPALVRNTGGMPEMVNHGQSGYVFDSNQQLRDIIHSLKGADLIKKGDYAQEWAQGLRPELIAKQFAETYIK